MKAVGDTCVRDKDTHRWVAVAECQAGLLIVNFTSVKPGISPDDSTCVMGPQEWPMLTLPSCVFYRMAQIRTVAELDKEFDAQGAVNRSQTPVDILHRIRHGFIKSKWALPRHKDIVRPLLPAWQQK